MLIVSSTDHQLAGAITGRSEARMERKWWTLIAVCVATFMLLLDITIVNVALPSIQSDLDASLSSLQWVVDAYALTLAAFLLVFGSLGDRLGRRRIFAIGFGVFTFASLLCGLASDPTVLNLFRGLQGVGGAAMFATSLALIAQEFEGRERAKAIGLWGATVGGAVAIGPLVGGLITDGLGWEWIFFVNVPIGIAAIVLTETKLANVAATDPQPIDWLGVVSFSLALFGLIFGLIRGNAEGWASAEILISLIGAAVLMGVFVAVQARRKNAMLDLSLFRVSSFGGVSIVAWALSASMFALFLYITLYIQDVLGFTPLEAGVRFLPITVLSFLVAPVAANLSNRIPVRVLMGLGLVLVGVGLLLMHGIEVGDSWTGLLPGFLVAGIGIGMTNPMIAETALGVVPPARAGMASGINSTFRQVGIATGVAALGAVFQSQIESNLTAVPQQSRGGFADAVSSGAIDQAVAQAPPQAQDQALSAASHAFVTAFNEILLIGAAVAVIGGILGFLLVRQRDFGAAPEEQAEGVPAQAPEGVTAG
jgi:EmrB/QacA subfamily drug resistance transporter